LGLVLFHENERHIFGDLGDDVIQIAALRGDNFKLIFDFDNYQQSGEDVWATWGKLADLTDAIHLKDSTSDKKHVPVGMGAGRVKEIIADAVKRGWSGPLAVEPHLTHSGAVAATGPSGAVNEAYGAMAPQDSFHIAVETAKSLLDEAGAQWS
jgi:sugar phosphate isomerase/epimerase